MEKDIVVGHFERVRALAASGRLVAVGGVRAGAASRVTLFDHIGRKVTRTIDLPSHVLGLGLAGGRLYAACADGAVRGYDAASGAEEGTIATAHAGAATAIAVSADEKRIATAGSDGYVRLWSRKTGERQGEWQISTQPLRAVALDPLGELVAAAGDDGVVRAVTIAAGATGARRDMPGHEGAVLALAFTPRDGRLASGGEDGTIRLWYLVGAVEAEKRGEGDTGHTGAVLALLFPPTPAAPASGGEPTDRMFSAGSDGTVKAWRLEDRRKPRSLQCSKPVYALAYVAPKPSEAKESLGGVVAGGDARTLWRFPLDVEGAPGDASASWQHGFDVLEKSLASQKPAREAAIQQLAALDETEALDLLSRVLGKEQLPELRALAAKEIGKNGRRAARPALRERLDDDHQAVRFAAFEALRTLDAEAPLVALRAGLGSRWNDVRIAALRALVPLRETSPLVPGLVADKLTDSDATVRRVALEELVRLHAEVDPAAHAVYGGPEPLRIAFERGPADIRAEVLIRASLGGLLDAPAVRPLLGRALDDDDDTVRRIAFAVRVLDRRPLAALLEKSDGGFGRTVNEIARRGAQLAGAVGEGRPTDDEIAAARKRIPGGGDAGAKPAEADLEPLLLAMACRTPDTALRGARGLALLGDTRALGALLQLSREAQPQLRALAATALGELRDPRAEKRLAWMLDDGDASVRGAAADAYARLIGERPLELAGAQLRSSHEDIRVRGLDRLMKMGAGGKAGAEAEALLGDAVEDEAAKVRGEAFRTLWSWHDKDPEKALDRALRARFPDLRLRAVEELARIAKDDPKHKDARWPRERLRQTIADRDPQVAQAAYDAEVKLAGEADAEAHLLAIGSIHGSVRASGAKGARKAPAEPLRSPLLKLLGDETPAARIAAIETLDLLFPSESGPVGAGLASGFYDLKVRAGELLAARLDEQIIEPLRNFLSDKELFKRIAIEILGPLRHRAASALATLGSPRTTKYLATELLKDDYPDVREQAARGLCNAAKKGDEGYLLDALGHGDIAVRSWAAEGLARLGDARGLPVLTGTLRHDHLPIRIGAIRSFAALGPEGYGGMLQGLEDRDRDVQETFFAIVLARDLIAFRRGAAPDLLTSALSSERPAIRYAAARAIELRTDPGAYLAYLIDVLAPPKPEKAADMKEWPSEEVRGRMLVGLAEALAADAPPERYAACQVLLLRRKPAEYWKQLQRLTRPRSTDATVVPDTTPRGPDDKDVKPKRDWLRRLFSWGKPEGETTARGETPAPRADEQHLRWLAFGAYVGLLRQATAGDEESTRVRRDAIDRIVELCSAGHVSHTAALPPIARALDDAHHLVRRQAFAGLKRLFPENSDEPLALALASTADDVARAALDELAARGAGTRPRIAAALDSPLADVRRYAFELLERLSPKGSLDPLLAAIASAHADLRLGVVERLAASDDPRVTAALGRAMESDHEDLRLRAAELVAQRKDDRAVPVLAAFLRADDGKQVARAQQTLIELATPKAVRALAARLEEAQPAERVKLADALGRTRNVEAIAPLAARFEDEAAEVRQAAFAACIDIAGKDRKKRDASKSLQFLKIAVRAKDAALRLAAARELDAVADAAADGLLAPLLSDRDLTTRVEAANGYARRVTGETQLPAVDARAAEVPIAPLEAVLAAGTRELMLPAAEGMAARRLPAAFRPLLLFVRAGESGERERALLSLGTLGDLRALEEIEQIASGGTEEAPADESMQAAAIEALGRLYNRITDIEVRQRVWERVELAVLQGKGALRPAGARGLRHIGGERARARLEVIAVEESESELQLIAIRALEKMGDVAAEAALAKALDDYDDDVRRAARKALDALFPNDRARVEFHAAASEQEDIAEPAAAWLADEGDAAAVIARMGHKLADGLRSRLRFGLARRAALPVAELVKLLHHDTPAARRDAAWLAGNIEIADADRKTIATALLDAERKTAERWRAAPPVAAGDDDDDDDSSRNTRRDEAAAWAEILWAAARVAPRAAAPPSRALLTNTSVETPAEVRRAAAAALGRAAPPDARADAADIDALVRALTDVDTGVRAAAAAALSQVAPDRAPALAAEVRPFDAVAFGRATASVTRTPAAEEKLLATDAGRRVLLPALIAAHDGRALAQLARTTPDATTRTDAVLALGRIGGPGAIATLQALAFDKKWADPATRKIAFRALRRAQRHAAPKDGDASSGGAQS